MKRRAFVLSLAFYQIITGSALAETIFLGRLLYTKAENCARQSAGSFYGSTYLPSNIGDNGNRTIITETYDVGGHTYILEGGRFTKLFKTVVDQSHGQGVGIGASRIRVTASDPADAAITETTEFIRLEGQMETPQGDNGVGGKKCLMSFRAVYVRK